MLPVTPSSTRLPANGPLIPRLLARPIPSPRLRGRAREAVSLFSVKMRRRPPQREVGVDHVEDVGVGGDDRHEPARSDDDGPRLAISSRKRRTIDSTRPAKP